MKKNLFKKVLSISVAMFLIVVQVGAIEIVSVEETTEEKNENVVSTEVEIVESFDNVDLRATKTTPVSTKNWAKDRGAVTPWLTSTHALPYGDTMEFTAVANEGWEFDYWIICGMQAGPGNLYKDWYVTNGDKVTVTGGSNYMSVEPIFKKYIPETYNANVTVTKGGEIAYSSWNELNNQHSGTPILNMVLTEGSHSNPFPNGGDICFKPKAHPGYKLDYMEVTSSPGHTSISKVHNDIYDVTNDVYLNAYFIQDEFDIVASANTGGTITPEGTTVVLGTENQTYNISADQGYLLKDVLVDGVSMGKINSYTFENVVKDHTIEAVFVSNNAPTLVVTSFEEVNAGDDFNTLINVTATDTEDGDLTSNVKVKGSVNTNSAGIYKLEYSVTDSNNKTATASRVVLVNDGTYVVGDSAIIMAKNFTINDKDVVVSDEAIKKLASMKVFNKADGDDITAVTEVTVDSGSYEKVAKKHTINFTVASDTKATIDVVATVKKTSKPVDPVKPTDPPVINLGCGENSYWNEDLKMCICEPQYINWEGAGIGCLTEYVPPVIQPEPEIEEPVIEEDVIVEPEVEVSPEVIETPEIEADIEEPVVEEVPAPEEMTSILSLLFILLTLGTGAFIIAAKKRDEETQDLLKFKVIGGVLAVVSVLIFILTGGLHSSFTLLDNITPIFGIIFVAILAIYGVQKFTINRR
ncbi:MAG: immunoglobulin-like domain-containing protein [Anaerorhabdus sp.]